jgi:hypothetical protein
MAPFAFALPSVPADNIRVSPPRSAHVHRECQNAPDLPPVIHPPITLAPCRLLGISDRLDARDMMVVSDFGPAGRHENSSTPLV